MSRSGSLLLALVISVAPGAAAQVPSRAALKLQAVATFADQPFVGAGLGVAWRTAARFTAELHASVGAQEGTVAARGEALVAFHLDPFRPRGVAPYAGGGVAAMVREGVRGEFLVLLVGVESRPGSRRGWFAELGLGGGVRAALGARLSLR